MTKTTGANLSKRGPVATWFTLPGHRTLILAAIGTLIFAIAFIHHERTQWPENTNDFLFVNIFGPFSLILGLIGASAKLQPKVKAIQKIGPAATAFFVLDILSLIGIIWLNSTGIWGVELMLKAGSLVLVMIVMTIAAIIAVAIHKRRRKK